MLGHPTTPVYFVPGKQGGGNSMVGVMTGGSSAFSPLIVSQASGKEKRSSDPATSSKVILHGERIVLDLLVPNFIP